MNNKWIDKINLNGWYKFKSVYTTKVCEVAKLDLTQKIPYYHKIQKRNGVYSDCKNAFHHTIIGCRERQLPLFDPFPIFDEIKKYFNGNFILNACGATITYPHEKLYTQNIHRDSRSFLKDKYQLNFVLLLDNTCEQNGSTVILEGSHLKPEKPTKKEFLQKSIRVNGHIGDLIAFDGNLWHASGLNKSNHPRHVITFQFTKPFIKQALDYPYAFKDLNLNNHSRELKQVLGFNAKVPRSISQFYRPKEQRFYKSDQG